MKLTLTVSSHCHLQGCTLDLEKSIKEKLTIDNPQYIAAKRYGRWIGKKLKPKLKYYEQLPEALTFPRGFSNQAVLLCRQLMGESPEIIDKRRVLKDVMYSFAGDLRPYQKIAVERATGRSFGVLEAGTGSGKTVMALALIAEKKQPSLVIVHTKELLYQWRDRAEQFLGCSPGLIGDGKFQLEDMTIAIVNSARKRVDELVPLFGHVVVDECHRVPATLFTEVVSAFDSKYLLGLSATAYRSDDGMTKLIYYFMGDRLHSVDSEELAATGAIVRPKVLVKRTDFKYRYRGDYQALIKSLTVHEGRNLQILGDIVTTVCGNHGGTALVVSDRINHCQLFADQLEKKKIRVALLTGKTPPESRLKIVDDVQRGDMQVLVATLQLISEGFDCSGLSSLFLTTPIKFEGRLRQVIGRIMRPEKNKHALVFDYFDAEVSTLCKSAKIRHKFLQTL